MTTKIKWRLGKLPDPSEVTLLLKEGVLTKEEAREILFSLEKEEDRDKKSLQEEIKFLRELVQSLSTARTIVEHIYNYQKPYQQYPWWNNYQAYCTNVGNLASSASGPGLSTPSYTTTGATSAVYSLNSVSSSAQALLSTAPDFKDIKTF